MGNPVVHFEINGTDGEALQRFYADLFGWHVQAMPEANYWTFDTHAGRGINGAVGVSQEGQPFLTFYVEGPDPQALLDRAESLGAKTLVPVTEMSMVTFAILQDPQGNAIGLVKGPEGEEGGVSEGDGVAVSWFEVLGPDPKALRDFYLELFDWRLLHPDAPTGEWEYYEVDPGERGSKGAIGGTQDGRPHVSVYAEVDDVQKYLERAESMGGKTLMPPTDVQEHITVAQFADPQGIGFGLYRQER